MKIGLAAMSASLMALAVAQGALAQTAAPTGKPDDDKGIADIVVTATRQATNMQDTPIAITAVTAQTLETRGLKSTADLSNIVPNATFRRVQGAFGPGVSAFIRGIGQSDTSLGNEPAVAYYVDDIYYPLLLGSNFDLLDLDHIEVLRGPQGTLFGRNALAGAINIVSKQPSLTDSSGYVQATTGSYNRRDFRAGFNVALTETLGVSLSGLSKYRDGYQKLLDFRCQMIKNGTPQLAGTLPFTDAINTPSLNASPSNCTVGRLGGEDVRAGRGTILWKPASNIKLTINGDYTRDRSPNPADQLITVTGPGGVNVQSETNYFGVAYDKRFVTGNPYTAYATYSDPVGSGVVIPAYAANAAYPGSPATPANTFYNGFGPQRGGARFPYTPSVVNWGVSGKLVVGVTDSIDLTGIVGYRKLIDTHGFDVDNSPITLEHTLLHIGEDYKTAELRASGKSSLIDWVVGGFYFKGSGYTHAITYSPQSAVYKVQAISYDPQSKAVYANITVKPFARLDITAGGRYSDDSKYVDYSNDADTNVGNTIFQVKPHAKRFDWKFGADYHLTDATLVYASASTGARLPGYNARPQQQTQVGSYPGDETLAYELGFKTDLFDHHLRLNAAGFYTDYKTRVTGVNGAEANVQLTGSPTPGTCVLIPLPSGGPGATQCRSTPYNAATDGPNNLAGGIGITSIPRTYYVNTPGKVKGFELEAEAHPIDNLALNAAVGYSHFDSPDLKLATRANDRLAGIPEINASAGIQYTIPVSSLGGTVSPRLDWFYTGSITESSARNDYNQPAYSTFNLRVTYTNEKHKFTVAAGATNLFSKLYYRNFFVYQDIGFPNVNAQPAPPREWFLEVGKRF
ncbi:TonB-dependent receptor [Sphingomonas sp. MMS24-J13]|uniref:TonB-dependent receptor n=1 Tax=Sphingomonas sp. MMS24-J13 TaxID=3238686 RepID=UPI003851310F